MSDERRSAPPAGARDLAALPRRFYERPSLRLARDLLGRLVVREVEGSRLVARIVETEAYRPDDPASHSYRGPTRRNRTMFGPAGHLYVYRSMGIHNCMNVVAGGGSAVLIRALEPLEGMEEMARLRGVRDERLLCAGPGRACRALAVDLSLDGHDLTTGKVMWLAEGRRVRRVVRTPRIGISLAREKPWRFVEEDTRFASRRSARPPGPARRRAPPADRARGTRPPAGDGNR